MKVEISKMNNSKLLLVFLNVWSKQNENKETTQKENDDFYESVNEIFDRIYNSSINELKLLKSEIKNLKTFWGMPLDHIGKYWSNVFKKDVTHRINQLKIIKHEDKDFKRKLIETNFDNKEKFRILDYLGLIKFLHNEKNLSINKIAELLARLGIVEPRGQGSNQSSLNKVFNEKSEVVIDFIKQSESSMKLLKDLGINL